MHSGNIYCSQAWCWAHKNEGQSVPEGENSLWDGGTSPGPASAPAASRITLSVRGCLQFIAGPASITEEHSPTVFYYQSWKFPQTFLPSTSPSRTECKTCTFDQIQYGYRPLYCVERAEPLFNYSSPGTTPWDLTLLMTDFLLNIWSCILPWDGSSTKSLA